ncbi:MAG: hypothetical protein QOD38_1103 [Acidimicrobiaceae bacterium]|jgi:hypothetical protein
MSLETPRSWPPADAPEDDTLIVDGLERALVQARTKIPDHDNDPEIVLPSPSSLAAQQDPEPDAEAAVDSSAVMDVLRGAIARYTVGDGHEQGTWAEDVPRPAPTGNTTGGARHAAVAAGYAPDRRRLAAAVVVLFLLVGGFGYQRLSGGRSETVKTNPAPPSTSHGVTTLARPTTSAPVPPTEPPPTEPPTTAKRAVAPSPSPAPTQPKVVTTSTVPEETTTTETPSTLDPCLSLERPPECSSPPPS